MNVFTVDECVYCPLYRANPRHAITPYIFALSVILLCMRYITSKVFRSHQVHKVVFSTFT